jgi:hypothetical protein
MAGNPEGLCEANHRLGDLRPMSGHPHTLRDELGGYLSMRVMAALTVAVAGALAAWLFVIRGDEASSGRLGEPRSVTATELARFARSLGHPVYWAGEHPDAIYELTQMADGRVYVRYLTAGAAIGDGRPDFLTVATYPADDALDELREASVERDAILEAAPHGGLVVIDETRPTSVYLAYPGSDYQIEVYDPSPERALDLALSGRVKPAG